MNYYSSSDLFFWNLCIEHSIFVLRLFTLAVCSKLGILWSPLGKKRYYFALGLGPYNGPKFTRKKSLEYLLLYAHLHTFNIACMISSFCISFLFYKSCFTGTCTHHINKFVTLSFSCTFVHRPCMPCMPRIQRYCCCSVRIFIFLVPHRWNRRGL